MSVNCDSAPRQFCHDPPADNSEIRPPMTHALESFVVLPPSMLGLWWTCCTKCKMAVAFSTLADMVSWSSSKGLVRTRERGRLVMRGSHFSHADEVNYGSIFSLACLATFALLCVHGENYGKQIGFTVHVLKNTS